MATLSVWKFPTVTGAAEAEATLEQLQREGLINVHDAAIVSWPENKKRPKTHQVNSIKGAAALSGSFWGLLFGILFFVPFLGMAVGAAMGALSGSLVDLGIDDKFIDSVRQKVTPGTSALFVMTSDAVVDRVVDRFEGAKMELIQTNLSADEEEKLRESFGED